MTKKLGKSLKKQQEKETTNRKSLVYKEIITETKSITENLDKYFIQIAPNLAKDYINEKFQ